LFQVILYSKLNITNKNFLEFFQKLILNFNTTYIVLNVKNEK
jgi:hypothetical protein